jgi:DNA helicase II / ATP-dependent DNA helicase PcrA
VKEEFRKKKVSATTLNSFYDCPWQWYFRNFLGVPEAESEAMKFGSIVHGSIENVLKLGLSSTEAHLTKAIEEALDYHHVYDTKARRRMTTEALRALKRFSSELLPELYEERESEKALSAKDPRFPELTITGKIDLMEHDGGGAVRVTDFKTGRPRPAREIEKPDDEERLSSYLRQLAMYSYLLAHAGKGKYEVEKSRLYFVESDDPKNTLYETVVSADHIDLLVKDIADFQDLLSSGEWTERECRHKAYPGEAECPYCAKAKMYT